MYPLEECEAEVGPALTCSRLIGTAIVNRLRESTLASASGSESSFELRTSQHLSVFFFETRLSRHGVRMVRARVLQEEVLFGVEAPPVTLAAGPI